MRVEKVLEEERNTLEDLLQIIGHLDQKKTETVLIDVMQGILNDVIEDEGLFGVYKLVPRLIEAYVKAYQVPHWIVCNLNLIY